MKQTYIDPVEETGTKEINWDISLDTSDVSQIEVVESKSFTYDHFEMLKL